MASSSISKTNESSTKPQDRAPQHNQSSRFWQLLAEYPKITRPDGEPKQISHTTQHHVKTTPGVKVSSAWRLGPKRLKIAKAEFQEVINLSGARPSYIWRPIRVTNGAHAAINVVSTNVPYQIGTQFNEDFTANYHSISCYSTIAEEDVHKTAAITPFGLFKFPFMTFELRNVAQTFQRFIDELTRNLPFVFAYIDDLLVASANEAEHKQNLRIVFQRFRHYGLVISTTKT
ncbi:PREDICTED: uncharacterized protein LOC108974858 [Bactrocera latifrons]|uniref:uncharacterized protein LOC108974858 n=1 Tax=Bactrocera latifrons TaxID=174628 RepID=UPI0008DCA216|nr:PREDICTED: uncharacterized protein LOC108974858 [Bactrocera latifrons]